jgi:hypothetical protein
MTVTATNVDLRLRDGATDVLSLTGAGELRLGPDGASAVIAGTVVLLVPGVTLSTPLRLVLNTTTGTPTITVGGTPTTLAAGPYLRLTATSATLVVAGQSITGATIDIEVS